MKRQGKYKRNRLSLSTIYTFLIFVALIGMTVIAILLFTQIYHNAMKTNAITNSEQVVSQVGNTIDSYTANMENLIELICKNVEKGKNADGLLQHMLLTEPDVVAVSVYDAEKKLIDYWPGTLEVKEHYLANLSYINIQANEGVVNVSKPHVVSIFKDYYPWVVTISSQINTASGDIAHIAMDIKFSSIAKYVDNVGIGQHGYCYILDREGNIIYHPQQQLIYAGLKEEVRDDLPDGSTIGDNAIYTSQALQNCGWKVVGVCFIDEMVTSKVRNASVILFITLSIVCLITVLAGILFSYKFSHPAKKLAEAMSEFEHRSEQFVFQPVEGTKEITMLSDSFDHMSVKIQKLMEQVRQEEVSLRKTELKALQAQINPHFLYNTLDSIAWMCEDERNKDAAEMVNALAKLFRISISKGHELIPIEKEVEHAKCYLKIQNFRYKNQFTYHFQVEEDCLSYLCNKITLQPIIENAIYHGIDRMVDEGEIRISIGADKDDILFVVEDNGVGMTEEQCHRILNGEPNSKTGIGIKNVNDRIKIYFGDQYGLKIESELDEGTKVTIRLPKIEEQEGEVRYERK